METIQIELKNKNALSILKSLEKAKMIRLLGSEKQGKNDDMEHDADEHLFQAMEKNRKTPKVSRQKVLDTIHEIIKK